MTHFKSIGTNTVFIIDNEQALEYLVKESIVVSQNGKESLFNQLEGKVYVSQSVWDAYDKILPQVDLGKLPAQLDAAT
jgi:hypothetical protein